MRFLHLDLYLPFLYLALSNAFCHSFSPLSFSYSFSVIYRHFYRDLG